MTTVTQILKLIPMTGVGVGITKTPNVFRVMVEDENKIGRVMGYLSESGWTIHNVINQNLADEYTFLISKTN